MTQDSPTTSRPGLSLSKVIVGFTGTREGVTNDQRVQMGIIFQDPTFEELHHGDCVGADLVAHELAVKNGLRIVVHPPDDPRYRAFCQGNVLCPTKEYLARNRDIVDACGLLIAVPKGDEELRSGTWSTIRYARKMNRRIMIVAPSGVIHDG